MVDLESLIRDFTGPSASQRLQKTADLLVKVLLSHEHTKTGLDILQLELDQKESLDNVNVADVMLIDSDIEITAAKVPDKLSRASSSNHLLQKEIDLLKEKLS